MAKSSRKKKTTKEETRQTKKQIALGRKQARQNRLILISVGLLIAVIVVILAVGVIQELILKPARPVAVVNGEKIRADEYQDLVTYNRYNQYISLSNLQSSLDELRASPEDNEFLISFYEQQLSQLQSSLAFVPQSTLDEMIDDELIRQRADQEGLIVTPEEVEQAIVDDIRAVLSSAPQEPITGTEQLPTPTPITPQQIDEVRESIVDSMTISDKSFRAIVHRNLLQGKVQDLLASQVPTTGLVVNVQLIETETEEEALAAKARIDGGEEFAIVAQEVSTDTLTAEDGGNVGWVATGQLARRYGEDLEVSVFALDVDELAVAESNGMFYVVRVTERDENGPLPTEVLNQRQNSALLDWLEKLKASSETQIERLLDPDQIPDDRFAGRFGF